MNFKYYQYQLPNGYTIISPEFGPIIKDTFKECFEVVVNWLKEVRPSAYEIIKPSINNENIPEMLNKMFEGCLYDPFEGGCKERYFLSTNTLAFLYVISYYIQQEPEGNINPLLAHVMGQALLEWFPDMKLVEEYLSYSASKESKIALSDALTLYRMYSDNRYFHLDGVDKDIKKAFVYADMAYSNPNNEHDCNHADLFYSEALFNRNAGGDIDKALTIINEKLSKYRLFDDNNPVLVHYYLLKLKISSRIKNDKAVVDLAFVEKYFLSLGERSLIRSEGLYLIAKCYVSGVNNKKNIDKAKCLLHLIDNRSLYKQVGALLTQCYLDESNYEEAASIASLTLLQCQRHYPDGLVEEDEDDIILKKAEDSFVKSNLIHWIKRITQTPIYDIDVEGIKSLLRFHLTDNEYEFITRKADIPDKENKKMFDNISKVLRHPTTMKVLLNMCNRIIYLGTERDRDDTFLNFKDCGNIFIHGMPGSGKTGYYYSLIKRLKNKLNIALWSFKPHEFKDMCGKDLYESTHDFIKAVVLLGKDEYNHSVVFIDELTEFVEELNEEELTLFKSLLDKENLTFVCCSQHMSSLIDEYSQYAKTRICMKCINKEDSINMIGDESAFNIKKADMMYVLNNGELSACRKVLLPVDIIHR